MVVVGGEASLAEVVAGTGGAAVAFPSNGTGMAVVAGHPQVKGGPLSMQPTSRGGVELLT